MRICILTQPLENNYGGLLQAYALQTVLKSMGHEVWTENRKANTLNQAQKLKMYIKRILGPVRGIYYETKKQKKVISQNTQLFINDNIVTTELITSNSKDILQKYKFDAFIVGSDQVWRPCYSSYLPNYFLDFVTEDNIKRIAYAASFGTSDWELTPEQTGQCAALLKKFDAISVREDSGVELCEKHFGVEAKHLLDPTMLLDKENYIQLIEKDNLPAIGDNLLMTYILDSTDDKQQVVNALANKLSLNPIIVSAKEKFMNVGSSKLSDCIFPLVTKWLQGFRDAKFVVTDSFHGTVFSIIFNKPFIVIRNGRRGNSRFTSLLKLFGLEDRLVNSYLDITDKLINIPIDWEKVNEIKKTEYNKALSFIKESLK